MSQFTGGFGSISGLTNKQRKTFSAGASLDVRSRGTRGTTSRSSGSSGTMYSLGSRGRTSNRSPSVNRGRSVSQSSGNGTLPFGPTEKIKGSKTYMKVFNAIENGTLLQQIVPNWYTLVWTTDGDKLIHFATKVFLIKGEASVDDEHYKILEKVFRGGGDTSNVTTCVVGNPGHCIPHVVAKYGRGKPEHVDLVKKLFHKKFSSKLAQGKKSPWNILSGQVNRNGKTAGNLARHHGTNTTPYLKQHVSKYAQNKKLADHGLTRSNKNRVMQNLNGLVISHGHPSTWNNSVYRSIGVRAGGGNNRRTGTTRHTSNSRTTGNTRNTRNTRNTASSGRSKSTSTARRTSPTFDALPPTTKKFIGSLLELPTNEVKKILKGLTGEDRKKITTIWIQVLEELKGN